MGNIRDIPHTITLNIEKDIAVCGGKPNQLSDLCFLDSWFKMEGIKYTFEAGCHPAFHIKVKDQNVEDFFKRVNAACKTCQDKRHRNR